MSERWRRMTSVGEELRRSARMRWEYSEAMIEGTEFENRNSARRRHRPRSRSGSRQGDEGRGRQDRARHRMASSCRSARPATSSTATRCRRSPKRRCATLDGWIMGPIGHNAYPRGDPTWVMPPVRKNFDLFAALRPVAVASDHPVGPQERRHRVLPRTDRGHALFRDGGRRRCREFRPNDDITIAIARHHPQGLEPRRARGVRARAHAPAQEGHRRAQGAGLSARLRHVRRGMPQGREGLSGRRSSRR